MKFENVFPLFGIVAVAFNSCSVDETIIQPSNMELLTTYTWLLRAYQDGVSISPDAYDYDDTIKFTETTMIEDYNDDSNCGGLADVPIETYLFTYDEGNNSLTIDDSGRLDTLFITRLTPVELWLIDSDSFGRRFRSC